MDISTRTCTIPDHNTIPDHHTSTPVLAAVWQQGLLNPHQLRQQLSAQTHLKARSHHMPQIENSHTHAHTHTPVLRPFSGTTRVSRYQKGKTNLDFTETVSGSGISWAICKSAPLSIQITTPAPHHSVFTGRMPFLPPNQ